MNKEKFEQKFVSACQESGLTEMLKAANNQSLSQAVRRTLNILHAKLGNECTIVGRVQSIGEKTNVSKKEKEFFKRELILNASRYDSMTGEELTNIVKLTFAQKHCDKLDGFNVGDMVQVSFVLQGREYTKENKTMLITDIVAYNIVPFATRGSQQGQPSQGQQQAAAAPQAAPQSAAPAAQQRDSYDGGQPFPQANTDDLPF